MSEQETFPLPDVNAFDHLLPNITLNAGQDASVERFKEFLRIPTLTSACNDPEVVRRVEQYFRREAEELGLSFLAVETTPGWFTFQLSWHGSEPDAPSILLNSHYDVVPVMKENWHWQPFDAIELPNGDIISRGTQDMKCVCVQYLEAIRNLQASGYKPKRTVHLAFQPDEEMGGAKGMAKWIESPEFKLLNVAFALDEGIASESEKITVFYGERTVWWLGVRSTGPTGHGSRFIQNTSVEKLLRTVTKFLNFRAEQEALLSGISPSVAPVEATEATEDTQEQAQHHGHGVGCKHSLAKKLGDVVTLNLTVLQAGVTPDNGKTFAYNVIPKTSYAGFDIRIPPSVNLQEFESMLESWLEEGMALEFVVKSKVNNTTSIDERDNAFWAAFKNGCALSGVDVAPEIFPAATDGRYLRNVVGLPVIGFSPIRHQPILLHDHDERLNKKVFVEGIQIYENIIQSLSETPI